MPSSSLQISEPHPTYPSTVRVGRGGAGNKAKPVYPAPPSSLNHPLTLSHTSQSQHPPRFSTGRGGMGNFASGLPEERRVFHFDEELERQRGNSEAVPVYHVGRGGSGNAVVEERRGSAGSEASGASSAAGRKSLEWVKGVVKRI